MGQWRWGKACLRGGGGSQVTRFKIKPAPFFLMSHLQLENDVHLPRYLRTFFRSRPPVAGGCSFPVIVLWRRVAGFRRVQSENEMFRDHVLWFKVKSELPYCWIEESCALALGRTGGTKSECICPDAGGNSGLRCRTKHLRRHGARSDLAEDDLGRLALRRGEAAEPLLGEAERIPARLRVCVRVECV